MSEIDEEQIGILLEKFEVPSNGSTTQNSDPRSSVIPASSDNIGNFEPSFK